MDSHLFATIDFDRVADLYDSYVQTDFDIPFWLKKAKAASGNVLELACGTGRISLPLIRSGINLTCVDYAPGMLAQFRKKLRQSQLSCPIHCQDIAELNLSDRFDLIFLPFHSFSEIVDRHKQRLALVRIRVHLSPQGTFICALQNPTLRVLTMDGTSRLVGEFATPDGGTLIVNARMYYDSETHLASGEQFYELRSSDKSVADRRTLGISFYLFQKQEFESLAHEIGFSVKSLYGDYDESPFEDPASPFMIWELIPTPP